MKVEIKYTRFVMQFGRRIAMAQLHGNGKMLIDGSVAQILQVCKDRGYEVTNAQDILNLIVLTNGFAA